MGLKANEEVTSWVYVAGGSGGTCTYKVYDEAGDLFLSGNMTEKAGGRFYKAWTPDAAGIWTVLCEMSTPSFSALLSYHVELGQEEDIEAKVDTVSGYVSGIKGGGWTIETLKAIYDAIPGGGGGGIFSWKQYVDDNTFVPVVDQWVTILDETGGVEVRVIGVTSNSNEEGGAIFDAEITIDTEVFLGTGLDCSWDYFSFLSASLSAGGTVVTKNVNDNSDSNIDVAHFGYNSAQLGDPTTAKHAGSYINGHAIKIRIRQTSALETNPTITWGLIYAKMEAV